MFESIELRKAKNGFVINLRTDNDDTEYVYDSERKVIKFIKDMLEASKSNVSTTQTHR